MATNTFSGLREANFWLRPAASYTFRLVMLPGNRFFDYRAPYTHGALAISGWVRDTGGTPQRRVVTLKIMPSQEVIARTESDPNNGGNNYFFNGLQALEPSESYTVEVHNADGSTAPRIKDKRVPV